MARFAYFADLADGSTVEWRDSFERYEDRNGMIRTREIAARVNNNGRGDVRGYDEARGWLTVTRQVELKANPSRHECDDRCMYATGRTMKCECACGGKNHGRGAFMCEAA